MTLCSAPAAVMRGLALLLTISLTSCYEGEWRTGAEVPLSSVGKLLPTRDIERWELQPTITPYVVQVKGTVTPRCRSALTGTTRRTDTGKFRRIGGGYWTALAIGSGIVGGFGVGFGGAGWVSQLSPDIGRPTMYAVGGALVVGGLANCLLSIQRGNKLRYAMCGLLFGLGGAALAGAGMSSLPSMPATTPPKPLIDTPTFQTFAFAGGGLVAGAVLTGIISGAWRGHADRIHVVETDGVHSWDRLQGEVSCGAPKPLIGRTMGLDIVAENAGEGPGSESQPMRTRVALTHDNFQSVDLRGLRQALASCGVLRLNLSPDQIYEEFSEEYFPPFSPEQATHSVHPVHGQLIPGEGITLPALAGRMRKPLGRTVSVVPGISDEILASTEHRCRANIGGFPMPARGRPGVGYLPGPSEDRPPPAPPREGYYPGEQGPPRQAPSPAPDNARPPRRGDEFLPTPGVSPLRRGSGQREDGECSMEARQARFTDCESQCGKALEVNACVFDYRKCNIDARFSAQPQKDREVCDLNWEQCIYRVGVSPGSWHRCVDSCQQANDPPVCSR